jgi:hypothetical protein
MKRSRIGVGAWVALVVVGGMGALADPPRRAPQDDAGFMPKPGPEHRRLARDEGTWDASVAFYPPGGGDPQTSKGVETNTMLGGLWLLSDFRGEFGGQPFQGRGQTGYDPKKGKYVGTWVDTMSTRVMTMEGTYDESAGTMTMLSNGEDPATGKPTKEKFVSRYKPDGTRVFTASVKAEGASDFVKMMEITYTKRK